MWNVEFLDAARRAFLGLPERFRLQIGRKINSLQQQPLPAGAEKLHGYEDFYRIRSGDFRVAYRIDREAQLIEIVRVGHRRDIYRNL